MSDRLEVWKKIVDVQMHFNDLEMRIRNFGLTVLSAAYAGAGIAYTQDKVISFGLSEPIGVHSVVLVIATIVWLLFWFMERHWYHRMLIGAVKAGLEVEKALKAEDPTIALLAQSISNESRVPFLGRFLRSGGKVDLFYWAIAIVNVTLVAADIWPSGALWFFLLSNILLVFVLYCMSSKVSTD